MGIALDGLDHMIRKPREVAGLTSLEIVDADGLRQIVKLKDQPSRLRRSERTTVSDNFHDRHIWILQTVLHDLVYIITQGNDIERGVAAFAVVVPAEPILDVVGGGDGRRQ